MSSFFPNGSQFAVSTAKAAAIAVTAITNADPAVASASSPPADGSIGVITSGWSNLSGRPARVDNPTANTFQLEGFDTTDVGRYPAGEGAGTFQVFSGFVSITQVREVTSEGGDQNYFTFNYVDDKSGRERRKPTTKSAQGFTLLLDWDPNLPWYQTLIDLDEKRDQVVLRVTLPNGDILFYYGYIAFAKEPSMTSNENMTVSANFSMDSDTTRYPAV